MNKTQHRLAAVNRLRIRTALAANAQASLSLVAGALAAILIATSTHGGSDGTAAGSMKGRSVDEFLGVTVEDSALD